MPVQSPLSKVLIVIPRSFLFLVLLPVLPSLARADTIHLKNGTFFVADQVTEKEGQIEYFMGTTKYTIPKAWVDHIDRGGGPSISVGSTQRTNIVIPGPGDSPSSASPRTSGEKTSRAPGHSKIHLSPPTLPPEEAQKRAALLERILTAGRIDDGALAAIEREGNREMAKLAYLEAGRIELERGQERPAREYFEHALSLAPDAIDSLEWYTVALVELGKYSDAISSAEKITRLEPQSANGFALLGLVYYNAEKSKEAVGAFKRSMELQPHEVTQKWLEKAQRELNAEGSFNQRDSWHFTLHYEGRATSLELQRDLLDTLETQYRDLADQLRYPPDQNISVILYTKKLFFDITQAPSWAGGLNDGKLRIPIEGITSMTPELQRVLKHELTHSFLRSITRGRCPGWLNEGLAQLLEPRNPALYGRGLAELFRANKQAPLQALEPPFSSFSDAQAGVAYAESLFVVDHLRQRYGMAGMQSMLQQIAEGDTPEQALYRLTHSSYAQFEAKLSAELQKSYPD
jgi:tetratricopeptide (TPR) repeat protein